MSRVKPHRFRRPADAQDWRGTICTECGWSRWYRVHQSWWWRATHRHSSHRRNYNG